MGSLSSEQSASSSVIPVRIVLDAVAVAAAAENGGERNSNFEDEDEDAGCEHDLCCYDYSKDVDDEEEEDEEFEEIILMENKKKNLSENDLTKIQKKKTTTMMKRSVSFAGPEAMVTIKTVPNFRCDWSLYRHRRSIWYTDGELKRFRREFRQDLRQELRRNTKNTKTNHNTSATDCVAVDDDHAGCDHDRCCYDTN